MAKKKESKPNIFKTISSIFSYVALVVLVLIASFLIFYIVSNLIAKLTHKKPVLTLYTIVSPSMEPYIMVYDVIVDTRVLSEDSLKVGDVITFYSSSIESGDFTVTHQIIEMDGERRYITKGDNNQNVDAGYITYKDIVGIQRFKIAGLGRIQVFIASKYGWLILILIPALIIIFMDLFKLKKILSLIMYFSKSEDGTPKYISQYGYIFSFNSLKSFLPILYFDSFDTLVYNSLVIASSTTTSKISLSSVLSLDISFFTILYTRYVKKLSLSRVIILFPIVMILELKSVSTTSRLG